MKNYQEEIKNMSFEEALSELEKIVAKLENGKENLEDAISGYEYGNALKEFCEKKLNEAKLKIDSVNKNSDGTVSVNNIEIQ